MKALEHLATRTRRLLELWAYFGTLSEGECQARKINRDTPGRMARLGWLEPMRMRGTRWWRITDAGRRRLAAP